MSIIPFKKQACVLHVKKIVNNLKSFREFRSYSGTQVLRCVSVRCETTEIHI